MKGGESGAIACFGSEPERYGRTNTIHMKHNQILVCGYAALERRDHLPSRVRPTCLMSSGQELIIVGEGGRRCTLGSDVGGRAVGFVLYRPIRIELVRSGTLGVRSCSSRCRDGGLLSSVCSPCLRRMSSGANVIHPLHPISCMRTNLSFATEFVSICLGRTMLQCTSSDTTNRDLRPHHAHPARIRSPYRRVSASARPAHVHSKVSASQIVPSKSR